MRIFLFRVLVGPLLFVGGIFVGHMALAGPAADAARLDQLFSALRIAQEDESIVIKDEIRTLWAQSGSPTLDLLLERGNRALAAGDLPAAIEHFTAAIDHAPDFAAAWNGRATAYYLSGLTGPALADIARTLTLEPRHFGAIAGLAVIMEEIGARPRAIAAWQRLLALAPADPDARAALARLEREAGEFDL